MITEVNRWWEKAAEDYQQQCQIPIDILYGPVRRTGRGNVESTLFGRFLARFFSLSTDDVEESLPRDYNDDGEA